MIAAAAVLIAVVWWLTGRDSEATAVPRTALNSPEPTAVGQEMQPGDAGEFVEPDGPENSVATETSADLVVDIRGPLRRPGIIRLPAGSRVLDAIEAAGGLREGRGHGPVNLARLVVDGEQIRVGGRTRSSTSPAKVGVEAATNMVGINSADAEQLEQLDGIGEVLASRIVTWRLDNGPFETTADLLQVPGIGEQTLAGFKDQVSLG